MTASIDIRVATIDDDAQLAAISRETWSTSVSPAPLSDCRAPFVQPGHAVDDTLVAELDGRVVGYVTSRSGWPMPSHAHVRQLDGLAVAPEAQGQGFGRRLLDAAAEDVARRGCSRVTSRVLATNPASLRVHEAAGFTIEGRLVGEFIIDGKPVDDVLLARTTLPEAAPTC